MAYFLMVSLSCGVLILLVTFLSRILGNRLERKWRYIVWLVIALRMLIPIDISLPQSVVYLEMPVPEAGEAYTKVLEAENSSTVNPVGNMLSGTERPESEPVVSKHPEPIKPSFDWGQLWRLTPWIWLGGALIYGAWLIIGYYAQRRELLRWSYQPREDTLKNSVNYYAEELRIKRNIPIRVCKRITSPMLLGLIKPVLLMPEGNYTPKELEYILKHELSHIKRKDIWVKAFVAVVRAIHWFNPAGIMLSRGVSEDIEILCDARVVKDLDAAERKEYNEILLSHMTRNREERMPLTTCFGSGLRKMKERLIQVSRKGKLRKGYALCAILLVMVIAGSLLASCGEKEESSKVVKEDSRPEESSKIEESSRPEESSKIEESSRQEESSKAESSQESSKPTVSIQPEQVMDGVAYQEIMVPGVKRVRDLQLSGKYAVISFIFEEYVQVKARMLYVYELDGTWEAPVYGIRPEGKKSIRDVAVTDTAVFWTEGQGMTYSEWTVKYMDLISGETRQLASYEEYEGGAVMDGALAANDRTVFFAVQQNGRHNTVYACKTQDRSVEALYEEDDSALWSLELRQDELYIVKKTEILQHNLQTGESQTIVSLADSKQELQDIRGFAGDWILYKVRGDAVIAQNLSTLTQKRIAPSRWNACGIGLGKAVLSSWDEDIICVYDLEQIQKIRIPFAAGQGEVRGNGEVVYIVGEGQEDGTPLLRVKIRE